MARLHIVAVANRLPPWAEAARDEYLKRMPRGFEVNVLQIRPAAARRLRERLPRGARVVALDERGREFTTARFAALLRAPTVFVIGGPDGLDPALKKDAALLLRLSALTLPHALAQVVLCEQLYRAASLLTGHPYHRE
ncbi:MAG: 23S rRNA (pseudouridine(1915)-N(3))-methyltransferase RlmH [Burkholderiales bacterium]